MHNFDQIPEGIQILFVDYITKSISYSDSVTLQQWIESDPKHSEAFQQFKTSWLAGAKKDNLNIDSLSLWNTIEKDLVQTPSQSKQITRKRILTLIKLAATWLILISVGFQLSKWLNSEPINKDVRVSEYNVPKGSKSQIKLPDGTVVWLNAGSSLKYDNNFDLKERNIYLTGEAYFSVATNKKKPFQVHTTDLVVRAFGTKFNVKAYPDEKIITTTLEEGKIDIMVNNKKDGKSGDPILLKPNEKVVYFREGMVEKPVHETVASHKVQIISSKIKLEENINTTLYTSWKNSQWVIEGQTLKCLVPILERKYNMIFKFDNEELMHYKFTGIIQNETVEQILKLLTYTAPLNYTIKKDTVTLSINHKLQPQFKRIITTR